MTNPRIFICHETSNSPASEQMIVQQLTTELRQAGAEVFLDDGSIPEYQLPQKIATYYEWFILVQTPAIFQSSRVGIAFKTAQELLEYGALKGVLNFVVNPTIPSVMQEPALYTSLPPGLNATHDYEWARNILFLGLGLSSLSAMPANTLTLPALPTRSTTATWKPGLLQFGLLGLIFVVTILLVFVLNGYNPLLAQKPSQPAPPAPTRATLTHNSKVTPQSTPTPTPYPTLKPVPPVIPTPIPQVPTAIPTPVPQVPAATPTPEPPTAEQLYNSVVSRTPDINDSLSSTSTNIWQVGSDARDGWRCGFTNGEYHISESMTAHRPNCVLANETLGNFAFQVDMQLVSGDAGGVVFHANGGKNSGASYYWFSLNSSNCYKLYVYNNSANIPPPSPLPVLLQQGCLQIDTHTSNTLMVIMQNGSINLYVNGQFLVSAQDTQLGPGEVGVLCVSNNNPTDVSFHNAKIWRLS